MTSRFSYGLVAFTCLALAPQTSQAQPYTNTPTVVVDLGALDPYGYPADSDYTQDIQSMPVAPPGAPQSLSPTGMNAPQLDLPMSESAQPPVLPQFAQKNAGKPFETSSRQLTKPVLEDVLQSAADYDGGSMPATMPEQAAQPQMLSKPTHEEILEQAVQNTMKAPPTPASKPSAGITWKESAFDDIIKPTAPAPKPMLDETASAALDAATPAPKSISPFHQSISAVNNGLDKISVSFERNSVVLDPEDKISLDNLISRIANIPDARLQLRAYASEDPDDSVSGARRLSLSRALTVRAYLMQQNVSPNRIDVRALGSDVPQGPADRVDLVVTN